MSLILKNLNCKWTLRQGLSDTEVLSVKLFFRPIYVNYCPSPLLSGLTHPPPPPPLPCVNKYTVYAYTVCIRAGRYVVLGLRQINNCRKVTLQVNFFRWRHFALPSMSLIFLLLERWVRSSPHFFISFFGGGGGGDKNQKGKGLEKTHVTRRLAVV